MVELQDLLAEVKGLYQQRFPLDDVEDVGCEAGIDGDGLHWVAYTGQGVQTREQKVEGLEDLLEEVKGLYNEKYPLDHVDDEETEVGLDVDGLLWVKSTGRGGRLSQQVEQLEDLLEEVKLLYSERYPLDDLDDTGREIGYDADGLLWVRHTGLGLDAEAQDQPELGQSKMENLEGLLEEVRRLYEKKYPLDCVDDLSGEVGRDIDGLLWVKYTGLGQKGAVEVAA